MRSSLAGQLQTRFFNNSATHFKSWARSTPKNNPTFHITVFWWRGLFFLIFRLFFLVLYLVPKNSFHTKNKPVPTSFFVLFVLEPPVELLPIIRHLDGSLRHGRYPDSSLNGPYSLLITTNTHNPKIITSVHPIRCNCSSVPYNLPTHFIC